MAPHLPRFYKLPDKDRCFFNVVGESHRMDAVRRLVRRAKRKNTTKAEGWTKVGLVLWLIPEPTNRFDPNAIRVCATADGKYQVVYVPAARAEKWAELIESPISVKGSIVGKRGKWGVKLDVDDLKAHNLRRRQEARPGAASCPSHRGGLQVG